MRRVRVASAAEIPPGTRKLVEVGGRTIAVFNLDGAYFALRNRCPHQGGPLGEGMQFSALTAQQPGEYAHERPGAIIRCPWHGWEFEIATGRSWFDPTGQRVRHYPAGVACGAYPQAQVETEVERYNARSEGGYVFVELDP